MFRNYLSCLVLVAFSAACGDDGGAGSADAGLADVTSPDGGTAAGCTCVALGADYQASVGSLSTVDLPELTVTPNRVPAAISSDPVLRLLPDGRLWIVNRYGADNVTVVDPATFDVVAQVSTGAGSNPQDVALFGDKAYVVSLARPEVLVYDAQDLSAAPQTIDLSSYDADGAPEVTSVHVAGDRVFVVLGRLDDTFTPTGKGHVVVIDGTTDTIVADFDLAWENPTGFARLRGDELLVSTVPDYTDPTRGCLERISVSPAAAAGCLVTHEALGGQANTFVAVGDDLYVTAIGFDENFNPYGRLRRVGSDGTVDETPLTPAEQVVSDVAFCAETNQLVVNDTAIGGLRVYDVATGAEVTGQPLDIGLPPAFANALVCLPRE